MVQSCVHDPTATCEVAFLEPVGREENVYKAAPDYSAHSCVNSRICCHFRCHVIDRAFANHKGVRGLSTEPRGVSKSFDKLRFLDNEVQRLR